MSATIFLLVSGTIAFSVSLLVTAILVVKTRSAWKQLVRQGDLAAVQRSHEVPTPRLGGIGVFLGMVVSFGLAFGSNPGLWVLLIASCLPLFVSGIAEDLGHRVSPTVRLMAAVVSSSIAVFLTGMWFPNSGLPGIDWLMAFSVLAILGTILTAAGISHAFNVIDGLNGLSGLTAVVAAIGIAMVARAEGDIEVFTLACLVIASVFGFLIFNFPYGRIFMGDSGAYLIGFILAWLGIALSARHENVSSLAMLLMVFWPPADMILAMYRRRRINVSYAHPDRLHFHQLVMRALEIEIFGRRKRRIANPLATTVMLPFIAAPVGLGVLVYDRPYLSAAALVLCLILFFGSYAFGMRLATRRTRIISRRAVNVSIPTSPVGQAEVRQS